MGIYNYRPYEASDAYNVGAYGSAGARTPESQANANAYANHNSPRSASRTGGMSGGGSSAPHQAFGNMAQHWASTLQSYMQPAPQPQATAQDTAPAMAPAPVMPQHVPQARAGQWDGWSGFGTTAPTPALASAPAPVPAMDMPQQQVPAPAPAPAPAPVTAPVSVPAPMPVQALATTTEGPIDRTDGSAPVTAPVPAPAPAPAPTPTPTPAPTSPTGDRTRATAPPTAYSASNPPPKPPDADMANSEIAAAWYRKFNYVNPAFGNITAADVDAYRGNPKGMSIGEWYLAGNRGTNAGAPDDFGGPPVLPPTPDANPQPDGGPDTNLGNGGGNGGGNETGGNGTGGAPAPSTSTSSSSSSSSSTPAAADPWQFNGPPDPSMSSDISKTIHDRFANLWNQERTDYSRAMNAQAALTGDSNSGGYGDVYSRGLSRLMGQESGQEAQFIQQANENTLNRNMELYGIKSNAQLQTFLAKNQDLLERYKAALAEKGVEYSADRGVDAAALHAAAASAAAAAGLEGAKYAATLDANTRDLLSQRQYDLGIYGLNQDTYKAQLEDRYKQQYLQWLMSPEYRLSQPPIIYPGNVGVP